MPVGDQLIGSAAGTSGDLVSLDGRTGQEQWRRRRALRAPSGIIAVVGGVLWAADAVRNQVVGFSVDSGRPVARVVLPRPSRLTGVLDQAGNLHLGDEHGWLVVDLTQARVAADVRFEASGIGDVYEARPCTAPTGDWCSPTIGDRSSWCIPRNRTGPSSWRRVRRSRASGSRRAG